MVFQQTIDNLRDRPHDERRAVAAGVAIAVVVLLFLAWGIVFLHNLGGEPPAFTPSTSGATASSSSSGMQRGEQPALEWQASTSTGSREASSTVDIEATSSY